MRDNDEFLMRMAEDSADAEALRVEIESLRAQVASLESQLLGVHLYHEGDAARDAECEELRAQVSALQAGEPLLMEKARDEIRRQRAEIERLNTQVSALQAKVHLCAGYDALEVENARLRDTLESWKKEAVRLGVLQAMWDGTRQENERLLELVVRLKNAVANLAERIGCGCGGDYGLCFVCRGALEELAALKEGK